MAHIKVKCGKMTKFRFRIKISNKNVRLDPLIKMALEKNIENYVFDPKKMIESRKNAIFSTSLTVT